MKTRYKGLLAGLALLLVIPAVPLLVALALDEEYYKRQISDEVQSRTGRPLFIEGDLGLAFGFKPKIRAETLRYPNASWGSQPWALEVGRAEFTLDLWALLRGKLRLEDVMLREARLHVEKNESGVYNLLGDRPRRPRVKTAAMPLLLDVAEVEVIDGRITVITRNRQWDVLIDRGQAQSDGHDRPIVVDARGMFEETPVDASATLGSLQTLLARQPSAFSVDGWVGADSNRLRATGRVRNLLRWRGVDLQLQYEVAQLAGLSRLFTVALPNIAPFAGRATLHQPTNVVSMQLQAVEARSTQFGLRSTLTGDIADLYRVTGIDLHLNGAGSLDQALAEWAGVRASSDLDTRVAARVSGSKGDLDLSIETATSENAQIALEASGLFNRSERAWRGALPVSLTVRDFAVLSDFSDLSERVQRALVQLDPLPVTATAEVRREPGLWHLRDIKLQLARDAWQLDVAGAIDDLHGATTGRLSVSAAADDAGHLQPLFAEPLPPLSALQLQAEVAFEPDAWRATVQRLEGRVYGVSLSADGTLGDLERWRQIDLAVSARADDLTRLPALVNRDFPRIGPLRARARLADAPSGEFHLTDITASNADSPLTVKAKGEIRDLGASMRADIDLDVGLASLEPLRSWLPDSPAVELLGVVLPLQASGKLYSRARTDWGIGDIEAVGPVRARTGPADAASGESPLIDITASAADAPLTVQAKGAIRDLGASMRADIDLDVGLAALEPLRPWLPDSPLAELLGMAVPLQASGKLYSLGRDDWGIRDIEAAAARVDAALAGDITALQPPAAQLHLTLGRFALADLPADWKIPRPHGGELDMALDLVAEQSRWRIENLRAAVNNAQGVTLSAQGDVERLSPFATSAMKLNFEADSLAALALPNTGFLDPGLPVSGNLSVSVGASGNHAEVDAVLGSSDARGTLEWRLSEDSQTPHWVDAKLTSERLDMREMSGGGRSRKFQGFSNTPLRTNWIHRLNGRLDLRVAEAGTSQADLRDVAARMTLNRGTMRQELSAMMGPGVLTSSLAVDANSQPLFAEFKINGEGLDTAGLAAFRRDDFVAGGAFDLDVDVLSQGGSWASLAANAGGSASFALNGAKLKNQSLDVLGGDIFSNLITTINPFRSIGEYVDIECAVMRFDIDRGVATLRDNLAVKTDRVTLSGAGHFDFKDQSLKVVILPKARKGFGINTSSLAKVVRLGGTLTEPKIEADASRLLETSAAVIAAFYSAGWSLIAKGLFDRVQANSDVCGLNNRAGAQAPDGGSSGENDAGG